MRQLPEHEASKVHQVLTYSENGLRKSVELRGIGSIEDYIEYCCFSPNQKVREIFWRRHVSNAALQVLKTAVHVEKLLALFEHHSKSRKMDEKKLKKFFETRVALREQDKLLRDDPAAPAFLLDESLFENQRLSEELHEHFQFLKNSQNFNDTTKKLIKSTPRSPDSLRLRHEKLLAYCGEDRRAVTETLLRVASAEQFLDRLEVQPARKSYHFVMHSHNDLGWQRTIDEYQRMGSGR